MKMQIRKGVFETNSSNTHNLTLFSDSDWKKYNNGELFRSSGCDNTLITRDEAVKKINNIIRETFEANDTVEIGGKLLSDAEKEYESLDKSDYNALISFVESFGRCTFGHIPLSKEDYIDNQDTLEYDCGEDNIDGTKVYWEAFHGRDG